MWDAIGGHVDPGETPEQALRRELFEELGVHVADLGEPIVRLVDPAGQGGGLDITIWRVDVWTGEPINRAPDEHDDVRWFERAEVLGLRLAHPMLAGLLDPLLDGG